MLAVVKPPFRNWAQNLSGTGRGSQRVDQTDGACCLPKLPRSSSSGKGDGCPLLPMAQGDHAFHFICSYLCFSKCLTTTHLPHCCKLHREDVMMPICCMTFLASQRWLPGHTTRKRQSPARKTRLQAQGIHGSLWLPFDRALWHVPFCRYPHH